LEGHIPVGLPAAFTAHFNCFFTCREKRDKEKMVVIFIHFNVHVKGFAAFAAFLCMGELFDFGFFSAVDEEHRT
jgi:hypothetical protein